MLLDVRNITVHYGAVLALKNVSFHVNPGETVVLIGPNGAGKSTALKAVSGLLPVQDGVINKGDVLFEGKSIKGLRTDQLVNKKIALVPEGRRLFTRMTVLENLQMGTYCQSDKSDFTEDIEYVFEIFPLLKERLKQKAGTLSGGQQQMLAIARALMLKPRLLLADEPSLGLSPNFTDVIFDKLSQINKTGTSVLLVEQNAARALEIADRGYVFRVGQIAMTDSGLSLLSDVRVKDAFLGG